MKPDAAISINIRLMEEDDLEAVHALDLRSFASPWTLATYRNELESEVSDCWVAVDEDKIVGMIAAWLLVDEIHIATIAVDENYRRAGIARKLLCKVFHKLADEGALVATLEVRTSNQAAQGLYRHFGFEVVGERRKYYRDNKEDALIMTVAPLAKALPKCKV